MFKLTTNLVKSTAGVATVRTFAGGRSYFKNSQSNKTKSSGFGKYALLAGVVGAGAFALMQDDETKKIFAADKVPHYGAPGTNKERTFIAIKPDGVHRMAIGEVIRRFEAKGYKLVAIKILVPSRQLAEQHYADLSKKPFFPSLVNYFTSGPVVAMVWEGANVISNGRLLVGATNPNQATPGTVRGDFCVNIGRNMIHGSDSPASAKDEISLWFKENEVADYDLALEKWIYENTK